MTVSGSTSARTRRRQLTRALVAAGAEVHELRARERSLEEVFLDLTDDPTEPLSDHQKTSTLEEALS